jgi:hypothetical protein
MARGIPNAGGSRFTPVGRKFGLKYTITFQVKGTIVNRKTGDLINMPERLAGAIAERMQKDAAAYIRKNIKRKGASTRRLENAVASPHNREVKGGKLRVMLPEWLNKEVVDEEGRPYWRAIDQGSSKAVGRRIAGVFVTGDDPAPLGRSTKQTFLGPRQLGRGEAGAKGREMLEASGFEGADARSLFRIKKAIEPMRFSQVARDSFALPQNAAKEIFKEFRKDVIVRRK